jgi:general secretion pathway protein H
MSVTGKGFTLLELLIVLAILTLLVAAMPLAMDQVFPRQRLRVIAQDLAVTLRDLRSRAVDTQSETTFQLAPDGGGWRSDTEPATTRWPTFITATLTSSTALAQSEIRFFPDGSSSGGVLNLALNDRQERVRVSALTGRIAREDTP